MPPAESVEHLEFRTSLDRRLFLRRLEGHEALSRLYRLELLVQCDEENGLDNDEIETLLRDSVYIALDPDDANKIHGIVTDVEMVSMSAPTPVQYRVTVRPRWWLATQNVGSWIYQDKSIPEIVRLVLSERARFDDNDFEFRLTDPHPKREYVVQYQESDFDFVSRLLESEGITYFFAQGDDREKIVFVDANEAFRPSDGLEEIRYDPRGAAQDRTPLVRSITRKRTRVPAALQVADYNYRTPSLRLRGAADVHATGSGTHIVYGEHVKTPDEARTVARLRAEEIACRRERYVGSSNVRPLHPGQVFTLSEHLLDAFAQQYLVTEVRHFVEQGTSDASGSGASEGYRNEFTAIPKATRFRPERVTPKPRIVGVMHGFIDAEAQGPAAPVDEYGRYKVLLPFDVGGEPGGHATRWIRMVQPYTGVAYGMHFPLHNGTEVMIVHLDGDPDRPVIVGSVPNHLTSSPVTQTNATQSVIRTRAGIRMRFEDSG